MSAFLRVLPVLLAALPAALWLGCFWESGEGRWVARVDGSAIAFDELRRPVEARLEANPELVREEVLDQELSRLVSEQLVLNRAAELGVKVHDAEVERRVRTLHGDDFDGSDTAYLAQVRRQMTLERTALVDLAEGLSVPESAIESYFEANRDSYARPPRVQIRQIVVDDESTAKRLRSVLEDGADFETVAAENSLAPEASEGGLLPPFARGELPEVFDQAFELRPSELSPVIESPYGFHIFRLEAVLPRQEPDLDVVREDIALELQELRLQELRREWLRGLRRRADVRVNEPLLEELR